MKIGKKFNKVVAGSIPAGSFKHLQQNCKYNEMVKEENFFIMKSMKLWRFT